MSRHISRSVGMVVGTAVTAALLAGPSPADAGSTTSATSAAGAKAVVAASSHRAMSPVRYSHRLADQMNRVRERQGLHRLRVVPCLNGFAGPWARHMANTGDLVHQELGPMMRRCNLSSVGEIIAYGGVTPREMIGMWLDSPGHRDLLLEPSFRIAGVAGRRGHRAWWGCIDFGRR